MKTIYSIVLLLGIVTTVPAQELDIPKNLELKTEADFKRTEPAILKTIKWLETTPINEQKELRIQANAFLLLWLTESPTISIALNPRMMTEDCEECLMIFLGGWTEYCLTNNYSKDGAAGAEAGAEAVIAFYEKNKAALGRQSAIEKWIKKRKKGQLKEYISANR